MKKIALFLFALITLWACKKTVEGETRNWEANVSKLKKLRATYPAFASVLDDELKRAEAKWKEAQGIGNEEEKIKKMSDANYTFTQGFVYELSNLETRMETMKRKSRELIDLSTSPRVEIDKRDLREIIRLSDQTKETIAQVEKMLARGDKSSDQAYRLIKDANSTLSTAETNVDNALRTLQEAQNAKKQTDTARKKKRPENADSTRKANPKKRPS